MSDVIVVGAGLSGLVCARRLVERGVSVKVLEARDRIGGRLHSVPFAGQVIDLGGHIMTATQYRLASLVEEFGVESAIATRAGKPRYPRGGLWAAFATWRATRHIEKLVARHIEKSVARDGDSGRDVDARRRVDATRAAGAPQVEATRGLERMTVAEYLAARVRHPVVRERVALHAQLIFAAEPEDIDFLAYLDRLKRTGGFSPDGPELPGGGRERYFPGGAQQLATKLADGLDIRLSTTVRTLEDLDAKRIVLAIPPSAMRGFIENAFVANTHVGSVVKVFVAFDKPYWRDGGWSGEIYCPRGTVRATFAHDNIITAFVVGREARRWNDRAPAERRDDVFEIISNAFGPREPIDYLEADWSSYGGCVASTKPFTPVWRGPHGRVHIAGTETASAWPGYMDGAIESGERAAAEVLAAL